MKYSSHGGSLGSYGCKLSEVKKPYIWILTPKELKLMFFRANRKIINRLEIRINTIFIAHENEIVKALKSYCV